MLKITAQAISILLHPLLMPTWLFGVLIYFLPASLRPLQAGGFALFFIFFGMTVCLPALNLMFFKFTGTIRSFYLIERRDRILPSILITLIYIFLTVMIFNKMYVPVLLKLMMIVTSLSMLVTIATFFFKISAHAVGMSGLAGILLSMAMVASASELLMPALAVIVLAGVTMSSRLLLNAHSLYEVGLGGALGFAVGACGVLILF